MLYDPKWEVKPKQLDACQKVALRAADIIENEGHCKKIMFDGSGYCVLGAIRKALVGNPEPLRVYNNLCDRLYLVIGHSSIATWNDSHTAKDATALLRSVA